jgi:hypothetical protein
LLDVAGDATATVGIGSSTMWLMKIVCGSSSRSGAGGAVA